MELIIYLIGVFITYLVIRFAVRHGVNDNMVELDKTIKIAVRNALDEHEHNMREE